MASLEGGWCIAMRKISYQQQMACTARGGCVFWGGSSTGSIADITWRTRESVGAMHNFETLQTDLFRCFGQSYRTTIFLFSPFRTEANSTDLLITRLC
jgi:hypothetical protein